MDKIYQHIDVREEGKENDFSIGKSLWIENEVRKILRVLYPSFFVPFLSLLILPAKNVDFVSN